MSMPAAHIILATEARIWLELVKATCVHATHILLTL